MPNENKVKYNTPEYNKAYKKGWVTKYIPETDTYQGQDLPEFELTEKDTRVADAVRKGRDEFAQDYIVPAAKAAASFTPLGPLIGLADAGVAFYQGDNIGGAIGAGMEALPYGLGKLGKLAKTDLVKAGKYLIEETALKNTYKYNPFAFKPSSEMGYRMLGKEGFEDALELGVLRAKPAPNQPTNGGISLARNTNRNPNTGKMQGALDRPYFADGFIDERYASDYMAAVNKVENNLVPIPTHKGIAPSTPTNIPIEKAQFYKKDWLKGYKEIPKPTSSFKSEINWGNWNKEIPENKALMKEYNTIEQTSKANGTWMKNPDGSAFQGTPEQFVQQNSQNFKKAFGNSKLVNPDGSPTIQYHGSAKKFDTFDESKFQLGDSGYSGVGIYTTPSKSTAQSYAMSSSKFHSGKIEPTVYELYGQANNPISSSQLIKENKGRDLFNFHRKNNWKGELTPEESLMQFDAAIADQLPNVERIRPWNDAREIVFPSNKQLKSAIGNNGMFDMTNPNIYKGLIPGAIGLGTLSQNKEYKYGGWIDKYK